MNTKKLASLFAELVGTFALTAVVIAVSKTYNTPIFTAIAAGATLAGLIATLGPVSGGHFNPAITLALFSVRKVTLIRAVVYVAMQAIGAVLAWKLFEWLSPDRPITLSSVTEFNYQVFTAEAVGTALFAMAVASTVYRKLQTNQAAAVAGMGLFIGSVSMAVVIIGRQIVTGVINPAVAIGIGNRPQNQGYLAYVLGPVVGAVIGMNLYRMFFVTDGGDKQTTIKSFFPTASLKSAQVAASSAATETKTTKTVAKKVTPKKKTAKRSTKK